MRFGKDLLIISCGMTGRSIVNACSSVDKTILAKASVLSIANTWKTCNNACNLPLDERNLSNASNTILLCFVVSGLWHFVEYLRLVGRR